MHEERYLVHNTVRNQGDVTILECVIVYMKIWNLCHDILLGDILFCFNGLVTEKGLLVHIVIIYWKNVLIRILV